MNYPVDISEDLAGAINTFRAEAQKIAVSWVQSLRDPAPTIYHYTNDVGLQGIVQSGQLWLADIFKLNDPSEVYHGFSRAIEVLKTKAAKGPSEHRKFADGLAGSSHQARR